MMRAAALLLTVLALAPAGLAGADSGAHATIGLVPCTAAGPGDTVDLSCPPAIRPGAASNACTLNFIVTDGTDHYIGAAGHCTQVGAPLYVAGVPGEAGVAVLRRSAGLNGDWAFFRIHPHMTAYIDPTMCRFGGPIAGALGASRAPLPGDVALHYGHGAGLGQDEVTKGRVGAPVVPLPLVSKSFAFVGSVNGGDSGSPVRALTGEAIGIAVATTSLDAGVVIAANFHEALLDLRTQLGHDAWVVPGDPLPDGLPPPLP